MTYTTLLMVVGLVYVVDIYGAPAVPVCLEAGPCIISSQSLRGESSPLYFNIHRPLCVSLTMHEVGPGFHLILSLSCRPVACTKDGAPHIAIRTLTTAMTHTKFWSQESACCNSLPGTT